MTRRFASLVSTLVLASVGVLGACGDDSENEPDPQGAGGSGVAGSGAGGTAVAGSGGFVTPADPGPGGFLVTVSGEDLGLTGYGFTSGSSRSDDPAFVDGWALRFDHIVLTVANPRLNEGPQQNPGDPTQVGAEVARAAGQWAVDVARPGSEIDKGSGAPGAHAIVAWAAKADGSAFDSKTQYAFSYDLAPASESAQRVDLDGDAAALYQQAISRGWAVVFAGTATYKGPAPEAGTVFAKMPTTVNFTFGITNHGSYVNCENPDLASGGGDPPRGVQVLPNTGSRIQITFHTDHGFWDALNVEGTPLHFDPFAAHASTYGDPTQPGSVTLDDLASVDFTAFVTKSGEKLPARSLVSDYTAPVGQLGYKGNGATFPLNSFAQYFAYSAMSGGHMNADGECEVIRQLEHPGHRSERREGPQPRERGVVLGGDLARRLAG